jgi:hypothetical protein
MAFACVSFSFAAAIALAGILTLTGMLFHLGVAFLGCLHVQPKQLQQLRQGLTGQQARQQQV